MRKGPGHIPGSIAMKMRLSCWYYGRFIAPYVQGSLQSCRPVMCRRLQKHLARCAECRTLVKEMAETHAELRARIRQARSIGGAWDIPERASWRRVSLADRVGRQLAIADPRRGNGRPTAKAWLVAATLAILLLMFTQPTPAREWIYHQLLIVSKSTVAHAPATAEFSAPPAPRRDPFQPEVAIRSVSTDDAARPAPDASPSSNAASAVGPPPPPALPESDASPTADGDGTVGGDPKEQPGLSASRSETSASVSLSGFVNMPRLDSGENRKSGVNSRGESSKPR
jgi:hypothetical protein